jgi:hypothetical protein
MESLKSIILETTDEDFKVDIHTVKAKSFTGVERKLKGEHVIAILRIDDDKYMAFVEE